jgi:hypothetical protein
MRWRGLSYAPSAPTQLDAWPEAGRLTGLVERDELPDGEPALLW